MDMFQIPQAFLHYAIVQDTFPGHPETDMVIDTVNHVIYLNLDADPNANVTRTVFRAEAEPEGEKKKKRWFR